MGRFWIESLRTDQLLIPGIGLPVSQVLSAVVVIASVAMILWKRTGGSRDKECSNDKGRIKNTD